MAARRLLLAAPILLLVTALVVGCGGGGGPAGEDLSPQATHPLVATWRTVFATADGVPNKLSIVSEDSAQVAYGVVQFRADLTFTLTKYRANGTVYEAENGTWSTTPGKLTVVVGPENRTYNYSITGSRMQFGWEREGHKLGIIWVKTATPTEHLPEAVGWWKAYSAEQNGAPASLSDRFNFVSGATYMVLYLKPTGGATATQYDDAGTVKAQQTGTWATAPGGVMKLVLDGRAQWCVFTVANGAVTVKNLSPDGGNSDVTVFRSWLISTWRAVSCKVNGTPASLADHVYKNPTTTKMVARVRSDGIITVTEYAGGKVVDVSYPTWSASNGQLTISAAGTGPFIVTPLHFFFSYPGEGGTTAVTFRRVS